MVKSVLILFLMLEAQKVYATNLCDGLMKIKQKRVMKVNENAPRYVIERENPEINCILFIKMSGSNISRPHYVLFTFEELSLKENPMQIKARGRKTKWEIKAFYANVHMSKTKVVVDARMNNYIILVRPRVNAHNFSVQLDTGFLPETANIPRNHYSLLVHCGLSLREVKIKQCREHPTHLVCTFECNKGYFPLFIDEAIYPAFIGSCDVGEAVNWPQEDSSLCISQDAVEKECMSAAVDETHNTITEESCPYERNALMVWFGETENIRNRRYSAFKGILSMITCPERCRSKNTDTLAMEKKILELKSPRNTECTSISRNKATSYAPKCMIYATNLCDIVLKIAEKTFTKVNTNVPRYIMEGENSEINCILFINISGGKITRPHYVRFTFKELNVKENPVQIKAKWRNSKWDVKALYANVHMSETKVVVDAKMNDFIILVTPRVSTQNFNVQIDTVFLPETTKIPRNNYPLLGHCGLSLREVKIKQCTEHPMRLSCTFECKKGYFPIFIDEAIYPAFTGSCDTGGTVNWPQEGSNLCVSQDVVVSDCLGEVSGMKYTSKTGICIFQDDALMKWFGETEKTSNISFSAFKETEEPCPKACGPILTSFFKETWQSPCESECTSVTTNGVTTYTPKCSGRPDFMKCLTCRYPVSSSPCRRMRVTRKK